MAGTCSLCSVLEVCAGFTVMVSVLLCCATVLGRTLPGRTQSHLSFISKAVLCPVFFYVPQAAFCLATAPWHLALGKQNAACGIPVKGPVWRKVFRVLPLGLCGFLACPEATPWPKRTSPSSKGRFIVQWYVKCLF